MFDKPGDLIVQQEELDELAQFVREANDHTYAAGINYSPSKTDLNYLETTYTDGIHTYQDRFSGYFAANGETRIWFEDTPVWSASYAGRFELDFLDSGLSVDEVIKFLQEALSQQKRFVQNFRGPTLYQNGDLAYEYSQQGALDRFTGREKIYYKGIAIFSQDVIGGVILHQQTEIVTTRLNAFREVIEAVKQQWLAAKQSLKTLPDTATLLDVVELTTPFGLDGLNGIIYGQDHSLQSSYIHSRMDKIPWFIAWYYFRVTLLEFIGNARKDPRIGITLSDMYRYSKTVDRFKNDPAYKPNLELYQRYLTAAEQEYTDFIRTYTLEHGDGLFSSLDQVIQTLPSEAAPQTISELQEARDALQEFFAKSSEQ